MKQLLPFFAVTLLLAGPSQIMAQSGGGFSLTWSTLDGGGGSAVGGVFSIQGSIGQPDAGEQSGDAFRVSGGFWTSIDAVPSGTQPTLAIRLGAPAGGFNTVILSWPNPSAGYVLQQTADMSAPNGGWTDVTQPPVVVGPNKEVTLSATGTFCMFRLRKP